jgi:hypothetical protein
MTPLFPGENEEWKCPLRFLSDFGLPFGLSFFNDHNTLHTVTNS